MPVEEKDTSPVTVIRCREMTEGTREGPQMPSESIGPPSAVNVVVVAAVQADAATI